jgi:hypothetical protein
MTARKGTSAKGPAAFCLMEEERDRLPERIVTKFYRSARLFVRFGGRGCT